MSDAEAMRAQAEALRAQTEAAAATKRAEQQAANEMERAARELKRAEEQAESQNNDGAWYSRRYAPSTPSSRYPEGFCVKVIAARAMRDPKNHKKSIGLYEVCVFSKSASTFDSYHAMNTRWKRFSEFEQLNKLVDPHLDKGGQQTHTAQRGNRQEPARNSEANEGEGAQGTVGRLGGPSQPSCIGCDCDSARCRREFDPPRDTSLTVALSSSCVHACEILQTFVCLRLSSRALLPLRLQCPLLLCLRSTPSAALAPRCCWRSAARVWRRTWPR